MARRPRLQTSLRITSLAVIATGAAIGLGSLGPALVGAENATGTAVTDAAAAAGTNRTADPVAGAISAFGPGAESASASGSSSPKRSAVPGPSDLGAGSDLVADVARSEIISRSSSRVAAADPLKRQSLLLGSGNAVTRTEDLSDEDPRSVARALLAGYGWSEDQFGCLDSLWTRESNWNPSADNPSSSAYGIPQALPGSKMSSAGADWATNPVTQIRWGLGYIADRYGSPCSAWGHSESRGYY